MILTGKLIEVGNLEDTGGRGLLLDSNGAFIYVVGLTENECRQAVKLLYKNLLITIDVAQE